jgi:effector-binding domain-containing protein
VALYADSPDDDAPIKVMAGMPIGGAAFKPSGRIEVVDLPAVARAATTVHRGSMSRVDEGYQALMRWSDETGERIEGYSREVYLDCGGEPETWITELQFALCPGGLPSAREERQHPKEERDRSARNI